MWFGFAEQQFLLADDCIREREGQLVLIYICRPDLPPNLVLARRHIFAAVPGAGDPAAVSSNVFVFSDDLIIIQQ